MKAKSHKYSGYKYDPSYCGRVIDAMARGLTLEEFAAELLVSPSTVKNWKREIPEFAEAFEIADNLEYCYTKKEIKGYITDPTANAAILKIYMTKYHGYRENSVQELNHEGILGLSQITMTRDEYLKKANAGASNE